MKAIAPACLALIASLWTIQTPPAFSQQSEPGKWIPLPYFRSGNWWMPIDVEKPTKLNASLVALAGMDCYLFTDSSNSMSLVRQTGDKIASANQVIPFDARHFALSQQGNPQSRVIRNDGFMMAESLENFQAMWERKVEFGRQARQAMPALPPDTSLTSSGWAVSSNSQPPVSPHAMDYNPSLGLLCVVQTVGERHLGSELRVWDVRSRSCLWRRRLPGSPYSPVGVRILNNGLVFVNGGYGKHNVCYLRVYDSSKRQTVLERDVPGTLELGRLRMAPLPDGRRVLTVPSLLPESPKDQNGANPNKGLRLFDLTSKTEGTLLPSHEVASVLALTDGRSALVGTMQGEILRLDLSGGSHALLGTSSGKAITALAASDDESAWAAGTREGAVLRGSLRGAVDATLPALDGEVTGLTFLRGSTSKLAIRVAGRGQGGFYGGYWVDNSSHADGVIWDVVTGERRPLPPGAGICALDGSILGLSLADGTGSVLYDAATGGMSEPLGSQAPSVLEREFATGEGLDKPSSLRTNRDGSQIFIGGRLFDFKTMRFEALKAARALSEPIVEAARMRMKSPRPVENDEDRKIFGLALDQAGADAKTEEVLDVLLLGPSRKPARVLLYPDPNTVNAFSGLSPSGKVAAIYSQWKGGGDLRLVDLERYRVMSQPNQGNLTENLQSMNFLGWVKPLDDDGNRVLAIHSNGGMVDMLDYAGGRTISRVDFGGAAAAACCAVEARRLFIATDDAAIHCVTWDDAGHLKPVGRLDLGMHDTWALTLPNGMFMSSGAERLMVLAGNGRALPLDTGAAAFHRPHDVARAFGASPEQLALLEKAYLRRCQRDGLTVTQDQQIDLKTLPQVVIRDRLKLPVAVRETAFTLAAEASASGFPLRKLLVEVNGVPLHTWKAELPDDSKVWSGEIPLTLAPGINKIQISAVDAEGRESLRETVVLWHIAPATPPALHLVAVGVSDYKDDGLDLGAASKDARDLAQLLAQRQGHGCREVRSLVFTDQQAMRESILQARDFLRASQEGDQVVVFVAGHGFVDQEGLRYWFGTHDIDIAAVDKRGVSYEELESLFDGVPARQRLLLMDTCFAGEVDMESSATLAMASGVKSRAPAVASIISKPADGSFDLMRELFSDLRRHTGATVITASSGMEHVYAEEREQGDNGVFTYCLLEGMRSGSADANGDGDIRLSEMQTHLLARVPQMTGGRQQPTGRHMNADADFSFGTTKARPPLDATQFVRNYLSLTSENQKEKKLAALFTEPADYFGKPNTRADIEQEEVSHHQRFPQRNFTLNDAIPKVTQTSETRRYLTYPMVYSMTDAVGAHKNGRQEIAMELTQEETGWKISALKVLKTEDMTPPPMRAMQPPQPAASTPVPPAAQQGTLQGAVAQFLVISSANGQEQQFAGMFAPSVDYFGKRFTREQIYQDEVSSHRNWPYRRLSLAGPVEQINLSANEVVLRYTMSSWQSKTSDGGKTTSHLIEMRLQQINGRWFITVMKVRKP
jgi:uncharacterized caspase-like protein